MAQQKQVMPPAAHWVRTVLGLVLAAFVFYPSILGDLVPLRVVALALGTVALLSEVWLSGNARRRNLLLSVAVTIAVIVAVGTIETIANTNHDRMSAVNAEHMLVLFPLYSIFGALSFRNAGGRVLTYTYLVVASVTAVLAVIESVFTVSLLGRGMTFLTSQREGSTRALVGAEHVLVLGALLAVAVALAATVNSLRFRIPLTLVLIAGCWATGSRAAAVLCVLVALLQVFPRAVTFMQKRWWVLSALTGIAFFALAMLSTFIWSPFIPGKTGVDYSANYRFASYALLKQVLIERPLGYVLGTVPSGEWMMNSQLRGPVDLARSADSELVFAVFAAGWLGIIVYMATFAVALLALRNAPVLGIATLLLNSLGFIMSLHGWDASSMLWYCLLGACTATLTWRRAGRPFLSPFFRPRSTVGDDPE
ncbi:hypothetical protein [Microbacterium sp.]|uniref:hypothetical protein n=1 Tax=Microbacterium sp. TaxID=51671 RepID=UPI003C70ED47